MKIVSLLLSLCLASVALAEEPAELVKLRKTWENSQAEAKKKAEEIYRSKNTKASKLYYEELYELKDNFMEAKNLQGAIAVDTEIKKLVETHGKQRFTPAKKIQATQKKASSLDGVWIANGKGKNYTFVFNGGRMIDHDGLLATVKYEKGLITVDWDNAPWKHKIKPSPDDPNVMTGTNTYNTMFKYTRVKW